MICTLVPDLHIVCTGCRICQDPLENVLARELHGKKRSKIGKIRRKKHDNRFAADGAGRIMRRVKP